MINPIDVYLAGGMRSNWQDFVKETCKDLFDEKIVTWNDPRDNKTSDPEAYGPMDRMRCDHASITFGYAEKDNPLPFPLFMEMGYALGQNKPVIFVNEIPMGDRRYRPFLFAKVFGCRNLMMETELGQGIRDLRMLLTSYAARQGWKGRIESR
ncbi:hypothetical protein KGO95_02715 [Patescibacteria group bacterium]|nr:hypothetical protein [Patescibacteria group bacterium]